MSSKTASYKKQHRFQLNIVKLIFEVKSLQKGKEIPRGLKNPTELSAWSFNPRGILLGSGLSGLWIKIK